MKTNNMQMLQGERLTKQEIKERLRQMNIIFDENSSQKTYYVNKYDLALKDPNKQMMIMDKLRKDDDEEKRMIAMKRERRRNIEVRTENEYNYANEKRTIIHPILVETGKTNDDIIHSKFSMTKIPFRTSIQQQQQIQQLQQQQLQQQQLQQQQLQQQQLQQQQLQQQLQQQQLQQQLQQQHQQQQVERQKIQQQQLERQQQQRQEIQQQQRQEILQQERQQEILQQEQKIQQQIHQQQLERQQIQQKQLERQKVQQQLERQQIQQKQLERQKVQQKQLQQQQQLQLQQQQQLQLQQQQPIDSLFKICTNTNDFEITKEIRNNIQRHSIQTNNLILPSIKYNNENLKSRMTFQEKPRNVQGMSENDDNFINCSNEQYSQNQPLPQITPTQETKSNISNYQMLSIGLGIGILIVGGYYCIKSNTSLLNSFRQHFFQQRDNSITILSFGDFFQEFLSTFNGLSNFFRNPLKTLLNFLISCLWKLGKKIFIDNFKVVISMLLIKAVAYFIWKQIKNKMLIRTIFNKIKEELKRIAEDNNDIYAGLSENDIIKIYSSLHGYSELDFQRIIMPKLRILRAKDGQIKEFEDVVNGKIQRIWQF